MIDITHEMRMEEVLQLTARRGRTLEQRLEAAAEFVDDIKVDDHGKRWMVQEYWPKELTGLIPEPTLEQKFLLCWAEELISEFPDKSVKSLRQTLGRYAYGNDDWVTLTISPGVGEDVR